MAEVDALGVLRDKPSGIIRITCSDDAAESTLRPMLPAFLEQYPDIRVEINIDYGFTHIVSGRFDAGIRLGESISKDMIAARAGSDWRLSVVGSPEYLERHGQPLRPRDLTEHACINIRHTANGPCYAWEFEKDGQAITIRVTGQFTANSSIHLLNAALDGSGWLASQTTLPGLIYRAAA